MSEWQPSRRSTASWVVYDLANTIFALGVIGLYFPDWLVTEGRGTELLPWALFGSAVIVAAVAPWIGARSDSLGRRIPYLAGTTAVAVTATGFLASVSVNLSLLILGIGLVGFHLGSVVYDALLVDVSTPETRGMVSGLGVGVGYVGSFIALGAGVLIVERFGYPSYFRTAAVLFAFFAIPAFLFIRERPRATIEVAPRLSHAFAQLRRSWQQARRYRGVSRFLAGRFLYTDAINTLISGFLAVYVLEELEFSRGQLEALLGLAILAAVLGGLGGGRLVDRYGPRLVLHLALWLWIGAVASGLAAGVAEIGELGWVLGPIGGFALGATWSADRVYMATISPPRRLGEFYGLYATVGRFGAIVGPAVWGSVIALGLGLRVVMVAFLVMLAAARLTLQGVDDKPRAWQAQDALPEQESAE